MGSSSSITRFTEFDALGQVRQSEQVQGTRTYALSYSYNAGGLLTSAVYPSGRVVNYAPTAPYGAPVSLTQGPVATPSRRAGPSTTGCR